MPRPNVIWGRTGIYKIENTVTGEYYVGSAVNIGDRKGQHLHQLRHGKHHSKYLQRSFNKHGEEAFVFSIIEEVPREQLLERESYWIQRLKPKYNGTSNTATRLGSKHSEETKQKLREVAAQPEEIERRRNRLLGKKRPPEVVKKISESLTGKPASDEVKQRLAHYSANRSLEERRSHMLGKTIPPEVRAKMSAAVTPEERQRRSEASKAMWARRSEEERKRIADAAHSEEAQRKRSESMKAAWADEEQRKQRTESITEAWSDEELRKQKSEEMKIIRRKQREA